jgi:DNA-3-methyladenine glycosylase II
LIILEQQVSLSSARAAYERTLAQCSPLTPEGFLELDDDILREAGFSRQKTGYCRGLARAVLDGKLDFKAMEVMDDEAVRDTLVQIKGIGPWSADIYLLMALMRPDIWPVHDLALAVAASELKGLESRPTPGDLESIGMPWRSWRAVAACILWHYYLSTR